MTQSPVSRSDHLRRFSDELDALAARSESEPPVSSDQVDAIFTEHEAECAALEAAERVTEAQRERTGRRA